MARPQRLQGTTLDVHSTRWLCRTTALTLPLHNKKKLSPSSRPSSGPHNRSPRPQTHAAHACVPDTRMPKRQRHHAWCAGVWACATATAPCFAWAFRGPCRWHQHHQASPSTGRYGRIYACDHGSQPALLHRSSSRHGLHAMPATRVYRAAAPAACTGRVGHRARGNITATGSSAGATSTAAPAAHNSTPPPSPRHRSPCPFLTTPHTEPPPNTTPRPPPSP